MNTVNVVTVYKETWDKTEDRQNLV